MVVTGLPLGAAAAAGGEQHGEDGCGTVSGGRDQAKYYGPRGAG
jgi:hypothetical protein